ncbi:MAG TPA: hypothetical protein VJT73_19155, partial [Polyangiaceae bacterium]|nr:hypothetical protein [Polyangiaceae bacterium]
MASDPLHLVATERHVEHHLCEGRRAMTWRTFVTEAAKAGALRPATPEITQLATAMALAREGDELAWKGGYSLAGTIDVALGALRKAGVSAPLLAGAGSRGRRLARLLEATDALLATSGWFDHRAMGHWAARAIANSPSGDLPAHVVVEGLFDWDPAVFAWVEALARRVPVTVRMPRVRREGRSASSEFASAPDAVLSLLEERWQTLSRAPDLELVEFGAAQGVTLIEAANTAAEANAVAGAVLEALGRGVAAERIAVVVPDLDEAFLEPLRSALAEARIAFAEPRGRPPEAAPAVRAALTWLAFAAEPLSRAALTDLLRTSIVDPLPFVDAPGRAERRRRGLALARKLERIPVETDRDGTLLAEILAAELPKGSPDAWMIDTFERIVAWRRDLSSDAPRAAIVGKLMAAWSSMGLFSTEADAIQTWLALEPQSREEQLWSAHVHEQAVGVLSLTAAGERVVSAAATLGLVAEPVPIARFRAEFEAALEGVAPRSAWRSGAVRIARLTEVALLPLEVLLVARASEGAFEPFPLPTTILNDDMCSRLPKALRPSPAPVVTAGRRTALLVAMAGASRVIMSRASVDSEGLDVAPAAIFSELALGGSPTVRAPGSFLDAPPLSERRAELAALARGGPASDADLARRAAIERARLAFFLDPRMPASPTTGAVSTDDRAVAELLQSAVGGTRANPIAATAIERASLCRFAAFAERVLGAATFDAKGETLEPWQKGSLIHGALCAALEATRARRHDTGPDALIALASDTARAHILGGRTSPLYRAELERALRD